MKYFDSIGGTVQGTNVQSSWTYDDNDPYAISITFHIPDDSDMEWIFSRETLHDALNNPTGVAGEGDVVWLIENHIAYFLIESPEGEAKILFSKEQVEKFLAATLDIVPLGGETVDIDAALATIFGG